MLLWTLAALIGAWVSCGNFGSWNHPDASDLPHTNPTSDSTRISGCVFHDMTSSAANAAGGGLYYTASDALTVENCLFRRCRLSGSGTSGGALHVANAQVFVRALCGVECAAASGGFGRFTATAAHAVGDISLTSCTATTDGGVYANQLTEQGGLTSDRWNLTYGWSGSGAGIHVADSSGFSLQYFYMAHNTGPSGSFLVQLEGSGTGDIGVQWGNVINNSVGSLFSSSSSRILWVQHITFINNVCPNNILFAGSPRMYSIQDCSFSNPTVTGPAISEMARCSMGTNGPSWTLGTNSAPSVCLLSNSPPTSAPPTVLPTRTPTVLLSKTPLFSHSPSWTGTAACLRSRSLGFSDGVTQTALRGSADLPASDIPAATRSLSRSPPFLGSCSLPGFSFHLPSAPIRGSCPLVSAGFLSGPLGRTAWFTRTASFTSRPPATPESTLSGSAIFVRSPSFRGTSQFSESWTFRASLGLLRSRAPTSTAFLTTRTIGRSADPFTVAVRSTFAFTPTASFSGTQLLAATGGCDVTVELGDTGMASTPVMAGLSEIEWSVSVELNATGVSKPTAFMLMRGTVSIGATRPLRYTTIVNGAFTASHAFADDSSGKGGKATSKLAYWIIIVIAAGALVVAAAAYLIYRRVTRVVVPECPADIDRTEWFDKQEREQLHEMAVDFQNPIALQSLETLMELSDAMGIAEMDAVTANDLTAVTITEMDETL